jgi:hypothetical protein
MTDLFISYRSHDRPWAERLFNDLKIRFPTIKPFWDRDPASMPAGEPFRPAFQGAARNAAHFVVFWSTAARNSNEVGPEIDAFMQDVQRNPTTATSAKRRPFYIPMEQGVDYGPLTPYQGFPEFQTTYSKNTPDRGISELNGQARLDWDRMIGIIGNAVLDDQATQSITLALLVMTNDSQTGTDLLDRILNVKVSGDPSLNEFLQSVGLTIDQAKARYGDTALSWRPFGTDKTIIDLMEDVREIAGRNDEAHRFHWRPVDFIDEAKKVPNEAAFRKLLESLSAGPSVVVTDPISLFHPLVQKVFKRLSEYAKKQQSMILSISPIEAAGAERLYSSLLSNGSPVLDAHLYPQIPATEAFAFCGVNVQHIVQVERLIRNGLGHYYLQKKKAETKPYLSPGG